MKPKTQAKFEAPAARGKLVLGVHRPDSNYSTALPREHYERIPRNDGTMNTRMAQLPELRRRHTTRQGEKSPGPRWHRHDDFYEVRSSAELHRSITPFEPTALMDTAEA